MADVNSLTLDAASWVEPRAWVAAAQALRDRYLEEIAILIKAAKLRQVLKGIGGDGRPLEPRIRPRADGATGKPLSPHRRESRSYKWVRTSVSRARGLVTVWWSHGWGRILGYHARGEVIGTFLRNLLDFPPGVLTWLKGRARALWRSLAEPALRALAAVRGAQAPAPRTSEAAERRAFLRRHPDLREYVIPRPYRPKGARR